MLNVVATFSLVWLALSVPLDESEQEALKELVRVWQLGASYASAVLDCPTRNAQVLCYASDYTNPAKRNRLKFLRVVAHEHAMAGTSIPTVIGQFKYLTGLSLRGNLLVGSIPREISRCREAPRRRARAARQGLAGAHRQGARGESRQAARQGRSDVV
jgi:hypothetical protein